MPFRLSPSSLGLFKECPRCFWLEKHELWQRPEGPFPSLPNGMDRILKKHFDYFRDKGELPPELKSIASSELRLFGNTDEEKKLIELWRNAKKGIIFEDAEGNVLHGAVDNILVKGDKLIVLDYKTRGYALKEDTHKYYQHQMDAYTWLLIENGFSTENYAYLLFYIPDKVLETGEIIFSTHLVKIDINIENTKKLFSDALNLLKSKLPERHREHKCPWCVFVEV